LNVNKKIKKSLKSSEKSKNMTFAERLERLIKEKKTSQKAVAEYAGLTGQSITEWKKEGTIPRADVALKMAEFLHVSVEYLVTGKDPGKPDTSGVIQQAEKLLDDLKRL
jgi:transcriptional regulator with XRE-family HTH domain